MSVRWAFNIGTWKPNESEWQQCLDLLHMEPDEQKRVGRFIQEKDRKCALIGRLLQRKLIHETFCIPWDDIELKRTREGKPYWSNMPTDAELKPYTPLWNYNVSHHGDWVVVGSESNGLIGMDVMKLSLLPSSKTNEKFFRDMNNCFTRYEWVDIRRGTNVNESSSDADSSNPFVPSKESLDLRQLDQFFRHWTLKEAYIKAVGIGLGFDLQRAEFHWSDGLSLKEGVLRGADSQDPVALYIDRIKHNEWNWEIAYLDRLHVIAVGIGPFDQSIGTYAADAKLSEKVKLNENECTDRSKGDSRSYDVTKPPKILTIDELAPGIGKG